MRKHTLKLTFAILVPLFTACGPGAGSDTTGGDSANEESALTAAASAEAGKQVIRDLFKATNTQDSANIVKLMKPDYVGYVPAQSGESAEVNGVAQVQQHWDAMFAQSTIEVGVTPHPAGIEQIYALPAKQFVVQTTMRFTDKQSGGVMTLQGPIVFNIDTHKKLIEQGILLLAPVAAP